MGLPMPPYSSGTTMATNPASTMAAYTSSGNTPLLSHSLTRSGVHRDLTNRSTEALRMRCSSLGAKSTYSSSSVRQYSVSAACLVLVWLLPLPGRISQRNKNAKLLISVIGEQGGLGDRLSLCLRQIQRACTRGRQGPYCWPNAARSQG